MKPKSPDAHDAGVPHTPVAEIGARLARAIERRAELLRDPDTTCCRLVNGLVDDLAGLVVERFGPVAIVQDRTGQNPLIDSVVAALGEQLGPQSRPEVGLTAVYVKHFVPDRSEIRDDKTGPLYDPVPVWGTPSEPEITVLENGLPFRIRPYDGFSTGLFLDQRNNRLALRQTCAGARVLNTFCYTGGFSVAAMAGQARRVVSVDVSKKYLAWAKTNCELLGSAEAAAGSPAPPEFFAIPIFDFFRAARKRGERYDRIILDPPSFGRDKKGRTFSAEEDYPRLIQEAWQLLDRGGQIWACTNHANLGQSKFVRMVHVALIDQPYRLLDVPSAPLDFPGKWPPIRTVRVEK